MTIYHMPHLQFIVTRDAVQGITLIASRDSQLPRVVAVGLTSLDEVRRWIPDTHVKADVPVEAPILEVWIDARLT